MCIFRYKIREERGETMPKLTFFYGVMNSSKSARALIQKFSFEEKGFSVGLLKPAVDTRDGGEWVRSRIGLCSPAHPVAPDEDLNPLVSSPSLRRTGGGRSPVFKRAAGRGAL